MIYGFLQADSVLPPNFCRTKLSVALRQIFSNTSGLAWDRTNERWNYVGHSGGTTPIGSLAQLGTLTGLVSLTSLSCYRLE